MDLTPHLLTGAAIGVRVKRPIGAITLAFLSHFVLDTIPHFDIAWIGGHAALEALDVALGVLLSLIIVWRARQWWPIAGAIAAVLPDAPGLREYVERPASIIFPHLTWYPPWGVLVEIAVAGLAFLWAFRTARKA